MVLKQTIFQLLLYHSKVTPLTHHLVSSCWRKFFNPLVFRDCVALCHPDEIFRKPKVGSKHLSQTHNTPSSGPSAIFPTVPCVRFEPKAGSAASAQLTVIQPLASTFLDSSPCHPPVAWMTPAVASGAAMPGAAHVVGGVAGALEDGRTQPGNRAGLTGN
jgi:hypothetical protein